MKASDRRRRIRIPLQKMIRHTQYQVLGTPIFQENSSVDLSSGGISFLTEQEYKKGALVLLEVDVGGQPVKLLVCVAWVKKEKQGRFSVGAELIGIDPEHKKIMQAHLAKTLQEKGAKKSPKKKKTARRKPAAKKAKKVTAKKRSRRKK